MGDLYLSDNLTLTLYIILDKRFGSSAFLDSLPDMDFYEENFPRLDKNYVIFSKNETGFIPISRFQFPKHHHNSEFSCLGFDDIS